MHRLGFGGGFMGLLFAAGSVAIFMAGMPSLWYFLAGAVLLGIGIAAIFHLVHP